MRYLAIVRAALGAFGVAAVLSACGGQSDSDAAQSTTQAPPVTAVVSASTSYEAKPTLKCNTGYIPVEIGVGTHTEVDAEYKLSEIRGEKYPYSNVQQAVKLYAKPPTGVTIPAGIVHAADSKDREFSLSIGDSGFVEMELKTAQYAYLPEYYNNYPISSITLCTKRTS